jgi:hypothetical protein
VKPRVEFSCEPEVSSGVSGCILFGSEFGINVQRVPFFFVDVHLHTSEIYQVRELAGGSGRGSVPAPMF